MNFFFNNPDGIIEEIEEDWDHDSLFYKPCATIENYSALEKTISGNYQLVNPTEIDNIVKNTYVKVNTDIKIFEYNEDQKSRFAQSVETQQTQLFVPIRNPVYRSNPQEEKMSEANYNYWMNMINKLGITKKGDLEFITRPDFPDIITQMLGEANRGNKPGLTNTYKFVMRIPPSLMEKKILEYSTKEMLKESQQPELNDKIKKINGLRSLCSKYVPMREDLRNKTLFYPKKGKTVAVRYADYRGRENLIRKHILNTLLESQDKAITTVINNQMKVYEERIRYVRKFIEIIEDFDTNNVLLNLYQKMKEKNFHEIFINYRRMYLNAKSVTRIMNSGRLEIQPYFSEHTRSSYYRYDKIISFIPDNQNYKLLIITSDKTINDLSFRLFISSKKFTRIDVRGDFNYVRTGSQLIGLRMNTHESGERNTKDVYKINAIQSKTTIDYKEYTHVLIDTVNLAILRNSVVYGDYQEAQDVFNEVVSHPNLKVIARLGITNIDFDKAPMERKGYKIDMLHIFKATGPSYNIMVDTNPKYRDYDNEETFRKLIVAKTQILSDIELLKNSGLKYVVANPQNKYYDDFVRIDDVPVFQRLHNKKGKYTHYSKTRHTDRFTPIKQDIIQTYLAGGKIFQQINEAVEKVKKKEKMKSRKGLSFDLTNVMSTTNKRTQRIAEFLILNDFDIKMTYFELNSYNENDTYTKKEIDNVFNLCINLPLSQTNENTTLLQAIRLSVTSPMSLTKFKERFPSVYNDENFHHYFENSNDQIKFRGMLTVAEEDVMEPLIMKTQKLLEIENETATNRNLMECYENENKVDEYSYNMFSPTYNDEITRYRPRSPIDDENLNKRIKTIEGIQQQME